MHISIKVLHCPYLFTYSLWQFSNVRKGQKHPPKSGPSTASVFGSIKSQMKFLSILGKSGHAAYLIKHCRQNLLICNGSGFFPSIFSVIFETLSMKFWIAWSQHKKNLSVLRFLHNSLQNKVLHQSWTMPSASKALLASLASPCLSDTAAADEDRE